MAAVNRLGVTPLHGVPSLKDTELKGRTEKKMPTSPIKIKAFGVGGRDRSAATPSDEGDLKAEQQPGIFTEDALSKMKDAKKKLKSLMKETAIQAIEMQQGENAEETIRTLSKAKRRLSKLKTLAKQHIAQPIDSYDWLWPLSDLVSSATATESKHWQKTGSMSTKEAAKTKKRWRIEVPTKEDTPCRGLTTAEPLEKSLARPDHVVTTAAGEVGTASFTLYYFEPRLGWISPWHDIPVHTDVYSEKWMITEIPAMTSGKLEMQPQVPLNPIKQDVKNGMVRSYKLPVWWNYGYLPQTWEDPTAEDPEFGTVGDSDPLDIIDIGSRRHREGEVNRVRILGGLAMIDDGELDWKLIAVDVTDPMASDVHTLRDLNQKMPHIIDQIRWWITMNKKLPPGQESLFAYDGAAVDEQEALDVVDETHQAWKRLRKGTTDNSELGMWLPGTNKLAP